MNAGKNAVYQCLKGLWENHFCYPYSPSTDTKNRYHSWLVLKAGSLFQLKNWPQTHHSFTPFKVRFTCIHEDQEDLDQSEKQARSHTHWRVPATSSPLCLPKPTEEGSVAPSLNFSHLTVSSALGGTTSSVFIWAAEIHHYHGLVTN